MKVLNTFFFIALLFLFLSCDKDAQYFDGSYATFNIEFEYPSNGLNKYKILFEGNEIKNGIAYAKMGQNQGNLKVYNKEGDNLLFSKDISITNGNVIKLISLGEKIDLYSADKYTTFYVNFVPLSGEDSKAYNISIDGIECISDGKTKNFRKSGNKEAVMSISDQKGNQLYKDTMMIHKDETINILTSGSDFTILSGVTDDNPPKSSNLGKARFFFDPYKILADKDSIKVEIYAYKGDYEFNGVGIEKVLDFSLKRGEISNYFDFDLTKYGKDSPTGYNICLYDAKDGSQIYDGRMQKSGRIRFETQSSDPMAFKYKYQTFKIRQFTNKAASVLKVFTNDPW